MLIMKLWTDTRESISWLIQILRQCLRITTRTTVAVIAYSVLARITRMLAFLLPLKVILLAGAPGVPRYFAALLAPDQKDAGILALSAAAILCYAITLFLEARSKRLAENGSDELLAASGVMALVSNQRILAQGFFARFMHVASGVIFALAGLAVLGLLNPTLLLWLAGLLLAFFLVTSLALRNLTPLTRTWLSDLITERLGNYLSILSGVAFLSSFLVILYPFVAGTNGNILVAIVCVVLLRQVLAALSGSVRDIVSLAGQRQLIDSLIFPQRQFKPAESKIQRTLRDLFGREDRERKIAEELADLVGPGQTIQLRWRDVAVRGLAEFDIDIDGGEAPSRHLRQCVFPPRLHRLVENEDLLFRHIARETVLAPPVVKRYVHGEHECLVYDVGCAREPLPAEVAALHNDFIARLWSVAPPAELVATYRRSHRILSERLTDDFVARMDIAADTAADAEALDRFRLALPSVQSALAELPLRLIHSGFLPQNILLERTGRIKAMGWGRWSLDPIGAGLPRAKIRTSELEALLSLVTERGPQLAKGPVTPAHLRLAARGVYLERAILSGTMKLGLSIAAQMRGDLEAIGTPSHTPPDP